MNTHTFTLGRGDATSSTAALVEDDAEDDSNPSPGDTAVDQKKRKRWKTLLDGLKLRRKRKSTKSRIALEEVRENADLDDVYHVLMVMESLYQAEERMLHDARTQLKAQQMAGAIDTSVNQEEDNDDDDNGSGVECLLYGEQQQPSKRMKLGRSSSFGAPSVVTKAINGCVRSQGTSLLSFTARNIGNIENTSDLQSILSIWSAFHRVDMVALFDGIDGEDEVELMLLEDNIEDMVMDMPWAFTPEQKSEILGTLASSPSSSNLVDVNDPLLLDGAKGAGSCTVVSWSGVSSMASCGSSVGSVPVTLTFTCHSRQGTPAVNPWAAAKRGNLQALQVIAATHDPSCWATEDSFGNTPLHYACCSTNMDIIHHGPEIVLFLLEQWPMGRVPSHVLEDCREAAKDHSGILRILNGEDAFIAQVKRQSTGNMFSNNVTTRGQISDESSIPRLLLCNGNGTREI